MGNLKKIIMLAVIVVLFVVALSWSRLQKQPLEVWVAAVEWGQVESTVSNTRAGTVKACRRSKLSMPTGGVVDRLLVDEGDEVVAGQLLLELWNSDRKAEVEQAEYSLKSTQHQRNQACLLAKNKRREAVRIKSLAEKKLASEETVDTAITLADAQQSSCEALRNQLSVAQARLELTRAVFERTQLRAPFNGVVAEINGEVGEYVTPSPPGVATPAAVDLIDYSCLYVTAPIDEVDAAYLHNSLPVRVSLDAFRGREFSGEVVRIAPYVLDLEKQARTVDIDVRLSAKLDDIVLLVGYSADITIILQRQERALRIPTESLLAGNQVWILDQSNGELQKRSITTGIGNWTYTEVLDGLAEGDLVVRNPDHAGIEVGIEARAIDNRVED